MARQVLYRGATLPSGAAKCLEPPPTTPVMAWATPALPVNGAGLSPSVSFRSWPVSSHSATLSLVSGVFQIIHAFATKTWSQFGLNIALGLLYIIGGLLIMQEPVEGSFIITLMLLVTLVIGGIMRVVIAFRHRELKFWWLMALGGAASAAIGVLLFTALPWSGLWVLGTLIGVELLIQGVTWLQFGLALRRHSR
jgi:uncharacterized membrane protein HdeD (DUF308 family)